MAWERIGIDYYLVLVRAAVAHRLRLIGVTTAGGASTFGFAVL
jgi:hypothetical protein